MINAKQMKKVVYVFALATAIAAASYLAGSVSLLDRVKPANNVTSKISDQEFQEYMKSQIDTRAVTGKLEVLPANTPANSSTATSPANTCLKEMSNQSTLDGVEDWISNAEESDLREALFTCSHDRYSSNRTDLSGPTALCSTIEPTMKIGSGDIYLLGLLGKAAPIVNPGIELAMEDDAITLLEKNRICRLVEASTDNQ